MLKNTQTDYGIISKALHWIIFVLVVGMILSGYFTESLQDKALQKTIFNLHKLTGICIFFLMGFRLCWILLYPKPFTLNVILWQRFVERCVHWVLYALLLLMPLFGWLGSSSAGKVPTILGWSLRLPIANNKSFINACFYLHNKIALVIIATVTLHASAALYHHFVLRDRVLKRMLF